MDTLTRRQVRYLCFRLQNEADGGNKAPKEAKELKGHMESQSDFGGWSNFTRTWDVDEKAHLVVVTLRRSQLDDWNSVLAKNARDLPAMKKVVKKSNKKIRR
jgi:hypothetical protein